MLIRILAVAVGLGSFTFYMAAFFFPEVHRRRDFFWSGVGFFYALVLWVCAGRITGGVLLGQTASVALLLGLGGQLLILRRERTSLEERTEIAPEIQAKLTQFFAPVLQFVQKLGKVSGKVSPSDRPRGVEDIGEAVLETPETVEPVAPPAESTPVSQPEETPAPQPPPQKPPQRRPKSKRAKSSGGSIEFDDLWDDDDDEPDTSESEDTSEVPEPAIVSNLEDLTNLEDSFN